MTKKWRALLKAIGWFFNPFLGVKVHGKENVPADGPLIVAPNHRTYFDPPVVGYALAIPPNQREAFFLAKEDLWKVKPFGKLIEFLNAIPLKRSAQARTALTHAIELLKKGGTVVIFPEGGRNKTDEDLLPFKLGVAFLAFHTGAPVVPAYITNNHGRAITKPWKWVFRLQPMHVYFGKPIDPADFPQGRRGQIEFTKALQKAVEELMDQAIRDGVEKRKRAIASKS